MRRAPMILMLLLLGLRMHAAEVRVFAAVSLTDAMEEIADGWEKRSGHRVIFNFGASSMLARQLEAGAPADLFISADEAQMDRLENSGRLAKGPRVRFLSNTLVIIVPVSGGKTIVTPRDLTAPEIESIAIAEPSSVPAGVYARQYLEYAGLWSAVAPKIIPVENVRAALAAVEAGNVDAAIVYRTDARISQRVRVADEITFGPAISYPFALLAEAPQPAAAALLLTHLRSPEAMSVFARHGFVVPSKAAGVPHARKRSPVGPVLFLTLRTAALSTLLILPPGLAIAWLLARYRWRGKSLLETLVALPLVMPPVATGLILLRLLGRRGVLGEWIHSTFGSDIVFTWKAIVVAMMVMSFPLFVRAARVAFEQVDPRLEQIARTLGAGDWRVFFTITLPLAARGIVSGMLLAFARGVGEFGATILVAGNIPGETSTLSLTIYNLVQLGRDDEAFRLLGISVAIAFAAVWTAEAFLRRSADRR